MDNHFNPGYMSQYAHGNQQQPNLGSFGNLSAPNQQQESPSHPTLPPLQSQNGGYQFGNLSYNHPGSQSQSPAQPHTPSSSMPGSNANAFPHMSPTTAQPGSMLPPSSFNQPYAMSQPMPYPSTSAGSMPPTPTTGGLPKLQPMPPGGHGGGMGLPSLPSTGHLGQQTSFMQNEEAPTHVVGSQGRRGILPSAPGRPNPPAQGSTQSTKSMIPQKDADGKFPCPHCNKTYLHAKHLKRHLLRHTGDRPYMCHLCKDTFSRSDILKRHFQKCSIRRGNPTGANHLAHQSARRNTNNGHRLSITQQDGPIGLAGFQEVAGNAYNGNISPTVNGDVSGRTSRANSIITPGQMSHRNSVAGLGILSSTPNNEHMASTAAFQQGLPAFAMPGATSAGPMQSNYAFNTSQMNGNVFNNQPQQMSFLGQQSSRFGNSHEHSPHTNGDGSGNQIDWNRMFNQGGQDGFIGSQPANASSQGMHHVKTASDSKTDYHLQTDMANESFLGNLYSHPSAFGSEYGDNEQGTFGFPNWSVDDPLQAKVESLMQYCFPHGLDILGNPIAEIFKNCLTIDNIKHFAEHYTSFHGHWPLLHMPTFKLAEANNALVLAIICIGAVYSPKTNVNQTRDMMEFVKATIMRNCSIYNRFINNQTAGLGTHSFEIEEMQALIMLQCIFTWHGQPHHRREARDELPTVINLARSMGLFQAAPPGNYAFSVLHSAQANWSPQMNANSWNWQRWLEQEKRSRALYMLFLLDAAMGMYFNCTPQIDPLEIRLMLPSDDAAWDAKDAESCAGALGLFGPQAQARNVTGTKRARQPGMREALRILMDPTIHFQPGATNAYSKFILIHALIVRIIACQKALQADGMMHNVNFNLIGSAPATPLSQNDWLEQRGGSGSLSGNSSGNATPTDAFSPGMSNPAIRQEKTRLGSALDRWKRAWDTDMDIQYPPGQSQLRRFGFSRDGVHFFYLGRSLYQSQRSTDWNASADVRFKQVMSLLKRIKSYVLGEMGVKGQDIGSVGDIDEQYGLDGLTLDMKLLFKPHNSMLDNPVAGVQTHSLHNGEAASYDRVMKVDTS